MKGTVLLVEDSSSFRKTYKSVLEGAGFAVVEAEDGDKAWALAQSLNPTIILLDLLLPKMSGLEVLQKVRSTESTRNIPVVIFSLQGEKVDIQKGLDLGANDYTVKVFHSPREVVRKIEAILANAQRTDRLTVYRLQANDGRDDAAKLQRELGLVKGFGCPACAAPMALDLTPDFSRADGHWFVAQFVCAQCKKAF